MNRILAWVGWPVYWLILIAAYVFLASYMIKSTHAQTTGQHPKPGERHWYDASCCSNRDCEPIPFDAIMEVEGGYMVDYVSSRFGAVREFYPAKEARHSQDGMFHVCFYSAPHPTNGRRLRCLYRPVNS